MFENNAKKIFEKAIERKKQARVKPTILISKRNFDKLRADIDYIAMMCDVELEEVKTNEQVSEG